MARSSIHQIKPKLTRYCTQCNHPLLKGEAREHAVCGEMRRENMKRAKCLLCREQRVGENGRYCKPCVDAAFDAKEQGSVDAIDTLVLDFIEARGRREEHKRVSIAFDHIPEVDDEARPVVNTKAAKKVIDDWGLRHPDGFVSLGKSDMMLFPVFSPKASQWLVFKCLRNAGSRRKFDWIPVEWVPASPDTVLTDRGIDWESLLFTPSDEPIGFERRTAEFVDFMDEAWDVAKRWASQLQDAWKADEAWSDQTVGFGAEVWAWREAQRKRAQLTEYHKLLDEDRARVRREFVSDARWDRDAQ